MISRHRIFFKFVRQFMNNVLFLREVLGGLVVLIVIGGVAISYVENFALGESIYFAFITGLSIGYGDITAKTALGQMMSIGIGMIGMILTGITVAIATRTLQEVLKEREKKE